MAIPVIDLFAGPGGLGEGFSALVDDDGDRGFKIGLSIEMDEHAHRTLELRAFFREFPPGEAPGEFYDYLGGLISRETLFSKHKDEAKRAAEEAWHAELGGEATSDALVDERIAAALGNRKRWVLIGGPPCQAYSLVGRSRVIGNGSGRDRYEADPRHQLYRHYLRILAVHQPRVFVMENVKGLLSAKVNKEGIFERILSDLRAPMKALSATESRSNRLAYTLYAMTAQAGELLGYVEPEEYVIRSEDYGVPQARHRIIILGVRADVCRSPEVLEKASRVSIEKVIGDLPKLRSGLSKEPDSPETWRNAIRQVTEADWMKNGNLDSAFREALSKAASKVSASLGRGGEFISGLFVSKEHADWYSDPKLLGVCNHETRGHIRADLHRYFFATVFARTFGRTPLLEDYPRALLPKHKNVAEALKETKFNDRFRVQVKGRPSTTVVSHIAKDGHYFIHYDPVQCRSLTVREAARLQTFPDNYLFEGPRTEQYKQVGNAVPPLLAHQIAQVVSKLIS